MHFEARGFCFFWPCAALVQVDICISIVCSLCAHCFEYCYISFLCSFLRATCIFHAKGSQFEDKLDPFQNHTLVSGYGSCFPFEVELSLKPYALRLYFLLVFTMVLNM